MMLIYVAKPESTTGIRIGVAYRRLSSENWDIHCQLKEGWMESIKKKDLPLVQTTLNELRGEDQSLRLLAWENIEETSIAPLRSETNGICEEREILSLLLAPA